MWTVISIFPFPKGPAGRKGSGVTASAVCWDMGLYEVPSLAVLQTGDSAPILLLVLIVHS